MAHGRVLFLKSGIVRNANGIDEFGGIRRNFAYITDNRVARNYPVPEQAGDAVSLEEVGGSRRKNPFKKKPEEKPLKQRLEEDTVQGAADGAAQEPTRASAQPRNKQEMVQPRKETVNFAAQEEAGRRSRSGRSLCIGIHTSDTSQRRWFFESVCKTTYTWQNNK